LSDLRSPSLLVHAVGATVLLVGATVLGVVKPRGRTSLGVRVEEDTRAAALR
jgi:hypothetical protein